MSDNYFVQRLLKYLVLKIRSWMSCSFPLVLWLLSSRSAKLDLPSELPADDFGLDKRDLLLNPLGRRAGTRIALASTSSNLTGPSSPFRRHGSLSLESLTNYYHMKNVFRSSKAMGGWRMLRHIIAQ